MDALQLPLPAHNDSTKLRGEKRQEDKESAYMLGKGKKTMDLLNEEEGSKASLLNENSAVMSQKPQQRFSSQSQSSSVSPPGYQTPIIGYNSPNMNLESVNGIGTSQPSLNQYINTMKPGTSGSMSKQSVLMDQTRTSSPSPNLSLDEPSSSNMNSNQAIVAVKSPTTLSVASVASNSSNVNAISAPTGSTIKKNVSSSEETITYHAHNEEEHIIDFCPNNRYGKLNTILGKGAYKVVWKALDTEDGTEVAWNSFQVSDQGHPIIREEYKSVYISSHVTTKQESTELSQEIEILKKVRHPNIISFRDSWFNNGEFVFITELMTSGTLREYIQKLKRPSLRMVKSWSRQILKGLFYLHSHNPPIIHRDIKCDNIFINGAHGEIKIGDMGTAKMKFGKKYTVIGTPEFMAPEMYEEKGYNEKVDIYAFGMCLLEMVTGEYPYSECKNAAQIYKKVSSGIKPECIQKVADEEVKNLIYHCIDSEQERFTVRQILEHPFFLSDPEIICLAIDELRSTLTLQVVFRGLDRLSVKFEYNVDVDTPEDVVNEMIEEKVILERYRSLITFEINRILREYKQKFPFPELASNGNIVNGKPGFIEEGGHSHRDDSIDLIFTPTTQTPIEIQAAVKQSNILEEDLLQLNDVYPTPIFSPKENLTTSLTSNLTGSTHEIEVISLHRRDRSIDSPLNPFTNLSLLSSSPTNLSWKRENQYKAELLKAHKEMTLANERAIEAEKKAKDLEMKAKLEEERKREAEEAIQSLKKELEDLSFGKPQLNLNSESKISSNLSSPKPLYQSSLPFMATNLLNNAQHQLQGLRIGALMDESCYMNEEETNINTNQKSINTSEASGNVPHPPHASSSLGGISQSESTDLEPIMREFPSDATIEEFVCEVAHLNNRGMDKALEWIQKLQSQDIMTVSDLRELHEQDWNNLNLTVFAARALKNALNVKYFSGKPFQMTSHNPMTYSGPSLPIPGYRTNTSSGGLTSSTTTGSIGSNSIGSPPSIDPTLIGGGGSSIALKFASSQPPISQFSIQSGHPQNLYIDRNGSISNYSSPHAIISPTMQYENESPSSQHQTPSVGTNLSKSLDSNTNSVYPIINSSDMKSNASHGADASVSPSYSSSLAASEIFNYFQPLQSNEEILPHPGRAASQPNKTSHPSTLAFLNHSTISFTGPMTPQVLPMRSLSASPIMNGGTSASTNTSTNSSNHVKDNEYESTNYE